ncbi:HPF/RaiA family ribosome-associated protein [Aquabacterium humicola]|uniref:HPF/RaiA family ribosome-associated protein n=1 Tax=Aquabacterium humicola TaxID=3237377 RepID=UPI002542A011|nr:HPF/RaiA family ribosome-associated protein [Rubrivivax pictus]
MKQPLQIVFIGMAASAAVEASVREKASRLDRFRPDLMSCRVSIELVDRHKHQGRLFAVRIDATMPGAELVVDRVQHEDVYVALHDAFDDMKRQVQDGARRLQGQVKTHADRDGAGGQPSWPGGDRSDA